MWQRSPAEPGCPNETTVTFAQSQLTTHGASALRRKPHGKDRGVGGTTVLGLLRSDRLLGADEEPPLGAHLVTPRFAYAHHGVYVGAGTVVHYAAFAKPWRRGPVEEISLARFAGGHAVWLRPPGPTHLHRAEIVRRARSRLGEDRYRFFSNNCEHLSEWCVNGEHRSPQLEQLRSRLRGLSRALSGLAHWLSVAMRPRDDSPKLPAGFNAQSLPPLCAHDSGCARL
jgi:hypothetical protein